MIERHVTFVVHFGREAAFEALYLTKYSVAMARQPGFVSVGLLREHAEGIGPRYQMVIRFASAESAAAWHDSADHHALSPEIKQLYSASSVVVYDVIA